MQSQSPERWIAWVRRICVEDGDLPYDDAEDGVNPVLLRYHRRTGSYPWQQSEPDVFLLRTLCRDYASAYWRKQKRRERLTEGWMPALSDGCRSVERIAIGELCVQEFLNTVPPRLRKVAQLRLQGDTCAEIAESLGVSTGTVQAYLRDLRQLFKRFYGYDPTKRGSGDSNSYGELDEKEGTQDENSQNDTGGAVILHNWVVIALLLCLSVETLAVEPQFIVTMRFEGNENRTRTFYNGQTEVSSITRTWQGASAFSISLSARSAGGQRDDIAELEGTLTIVRIRWTGDAQTPPPEISRFRVRWQQWSNLYVFSGEQAAFADTNISGSTPVGTYQDGMYHWGPTYGTLSGGRPQSDPWRKDQFFHVHRSQFTWNPQGWWETGENIQAFAVTLDADASLAGPNRYLYMECGATLYLTAEVTKFVIIGPHTFKKGFDTQNNPIRVLNAPDEGDIAVGLTFNPLLWCYEWTTDITHQIDFKPSFEAWHPSFTSGYWDPTCLLNPSVLWSTVDTHRVEINPYVPLSARVRQNYGPYVRYNMPTLFSYSVRAQVTDAVDEFTDVAEKKMRVHFPIEEWQQLGVSYHPIIEWVELGIPYASCPTKLALGMSPSNDWVYYGAVRGPATFQRTESQEVSLAVTGAIQLQPGVTIGSDIIKLAFQANVGVTLGATFTRASSTTQTWEVPAGEVWYFFWGYSHRTLWGLCDVYDQEGYAGTFEWDLLDWGRDPSGTVPIVWAYYVVR